MIPGYLSLLFIIYHWLVITSYFSANAALETAHICLIREAVTYQAYSSPPKHGAAIVNKARRVRGHGIELSLSLKSQKVLRKMQF